MDQYDAEMESIAREEGELQFERFSNEDALALGLILVKLAKARSLAIVIDIRRGAQQLFHYAFAGTSADNEGWIARKNRVVERFGRPSLWVGAKLRKEGRSIEERYYLSPLEYSPHGGAFPIILRGTGPIGIATVSGLKQEEDHALVVEALRELLGSQRS